jgi:hypothetical protein
MSLRDTACLWGPHADECRQRPERLHGHAEMRRYSMSLGLGRLQWPIGELAANEPAHFRGAKPSRLADGGLALSYQGQRDSKTVALRRDRGGIKRFPQGVRCHAADSMEWFLSRQG